MMELGNIVATATLSSYCDENGIDLMDYLARHHRNDWGDLDDEDKHSNNMEMFALAGHVLSKYYLPTGKPIYIETSWNGEGYRQTMICFTDER
ncbi:hypothetical protein LGN04_26475 [Burkholderia multivorans]|nr:hypothetical protein [Burkholderia multivorans]